MTKGMVAACLAAANMAAGAGPATAGPLPRPRADVVYPFRGKDGIIILDVRIGQSDPMPFILDTGASPCVVDPVYAQRLGIRASTTMQGKGGAGTFTGGVADEPVTLTIGSEGLRCGKTIVIDLQGVADVVGIRPAGLISADFFKGRVVEVNYDQSKIFIYSRAKFPRPRGRDAIPVRVQNNKMYVPVRLSVPGGPQNVSREVAVDTGSLDTVADPLIRESRQPLRQISNTGLGTGAKGVAGTWSRVEIGRYSFRNLPGNAPNVPIVGGGLLHRFNLVFDYDGGWLSLHPRKHRAVP